MMTICLDLPQQHREQQHGEQQHEQQQHNKQHNEHLPPVIQYYNQWASGEGERAPFLDYFWPENALSFLTFW